MAGGPFFHPQTASFRSLLPSYKDPCDDFGPTWIIQDHVLDSIMAADFLRHIRSQSDSGAWDVVFGATVQPSPVEPLFMPPTLVSHTPPRPHPQNSGQATSHRKPPRISPVEHWTRFLFLPAQVRLLGPHPTRTCLHHPRPPPQSPSSFWLPSMGPSAYDLYPSWLDVP